MRQIAVITNYSDDSYNYASSFEEYRLVLRKPYNKTCPLGSRYKHLTAYLFKAAQDPRAYFLILGESTDEQRAVPFISETGLRTPADPAPLRDPVSATRVLCGALILPTIATVVGKMMFGGVSSNFQRTLVVSSLFVAVYNSILLMQSTLISLFACSFFKGHSFY